MEIRPALAADISGIIAVGSATWPVADLAGGGPVRLEYMDGNVRAAAFYARHGFTEIGREGTSVWMERAS